MRSSDLPANLEASGRHRLKEPREKHRVVQCEFCSFHGFSKIGQPSEELGWVDQGGTSIVVLLERSGA